MWPEMVREAVPAAASGRMRGSLRGRRSTAAILAVVVGCSLAGTGGGKRKVLFTGAGGARGHAGGLAGWGRGRRPRGGGGGEGDVRVSGEGATRPPPRQHRPPAVVPPPLLPAPKGPRRGPRPVLPADGVVPAQHPD